MYCLHLPCLFHPHSFIPYFKRYANCYVEKIFVSCSGDREVEAKIKKEYAERMQKLKEMHKEEGEKSKRRKEEAKKRRKSNEDGDKNAKAEL